MIAATPWKDQHVAIAVTYVCTNGHHSIRYWRVPCKIHREVRCDICKGDAGIPLAEHARHLQLRDGLEEHLAGPAPYRLVKPVN